MILPDTNDYYDKDHEDIIHEQTNQNEVNKQEKEMIILLFRCVILKTILLFIPIRLLLNSNHPHQQTLLSTSAIFTPPSLVLPSTDVYGVCLYLFHYLISHSQQDYELVLFTIREKYEQEIISLNEKLQNIQQNLQEKNVEINELRIQLEVIYKNNEKALSERIETINHLNEQLHDCQQKIF
ncbi:unnamed protein product [Rotaria sordida]|uniref:Uncharacterized protein n=1 Tax=Rotaria sordida TaxID=392033 RepID=A0A814A2T8_9BILA|nr:unnamed protein product [Rotaria sordida]